MITEEHVEFLNDFPELNTWLNLNNYSLLYTAEQKEIEQIFTTWSNHSSEAASGGHSDADSWLMIVYCTHCKTIEVYNRSVVANKKTDHVIPDKIEACTQFAHSQKVNKIDE